VGGRRDKENRSTNIDLHWVVSEWSLILTFLDFLRVTRVNPSTGLRPRLMRALEAFFSFLVTFGAEIKEETTGFETGFPRSAT